MAEHATIRNEAGGITHFVGGTSAGESTITNAGGMTIFGTQGSVDIASAGNSALINESGGTTLFYASADGGTAHLVNEAGGTLDISGLAADDMSIGSIEGAGDVFVGSKTLTLDGDRRCHR